MQSPVKKVEKMLDRRRIVFHIFEDSVEAYGQTAGGWGESKSRKNLRNGCSHSTKWVLIVNLAMKFSDLIKPNKLVLTNLTS